MKLSTKSRYGLRALFDIAYHAGMLPGQIKDISRRQKISARYLEQIFQELKRAGLLKSKRGPQGGYRLTKKPEEITPAWRPFQLAFLLMNLKGIAEVIDDGNNGFLFQTSTPIGFTGKIQKLVSSPALRKRMAVAAHLRSLEISDIDNSSQSTAKLLLEIINRS